MSLLAAHGLTLRVGKTQVCRDLTFSMGVGERWALLGRNGTGKTTLLHVLAGLRPAQAGEVRLQGAGLQGMRRRRVAERLGLLPQDSLDPLPSTVLETALIGRHPHLTAWQWESAEDVDRALAALEQVELRELAERDVGSLSGGERRRLAIATLLTQSPLVYLLDEPTNHLDLRHQVGLLDLLAQRVQAQDGALMMSLHDLNHATRFCTHAMILLGDGEVHTGPATELLVPELLSYAYGYPIRLLRDGDVQSFVPA